MFPRTFDKLLELTHADDLIDAEFGAIVARERYPVLEVPIHATQRHGGRSTTSYSSRGMYIGALHWLVRCGRPAGERNPGADAARALVRHDAEWRDPAQIVSQWRDAMNATGSDAPRPRRLVGNARRSEDHVACHARVRASGDGLRPAHRPATISYIRVPTRRASRSIGRAGWSSRQYAQSQSGVRAEPGDGRPARRDVKAAPIEGRPLVPVRSRFLPGRLYMHDFAVIGDRLLVERQSVRTRSWTRPRTDGTRRAGGRAASRPRRRPDLDRNYIQLNSIAAGQDLSDSYFSASRRDRPHGVPGIAIPRRPARRDLLRRHARAGRAGLTRPHSARLWRRLWVDNSGYGEVGW